MYLIDLQYFCINSSKVPFLQHHSYARSLKAIQVARVASIAEYHEAGNERQFDIILLSKQKLSSSTA